MTTTSCRAMRCAAAAALALIVASPVAAQGEPDLERIEVHAANRPLASLAAAADAARGRHVVPGPPREILNFRGEGAPAPGGGLTGPDAVLQTTEGTEATAIGSGFWGADNGDNAALLGFMVAPPDTDGAIGPARFVQMINLLTTVYDKSGVAVTGPFPSNAFWAGMGGNCQAYNQGDPIVLYDDLNDRWLVSQFAFPDNISSFSQCVAVSQTGDPSGAYNRYEFPFASYGFNDYPKHGIVTDSITMTANLFKKRGAFFSFAGTFLGVMDKAKMYAGQPASLIGYNVGTGQFGFVAGDLDGSGSAPALFATAMSTASAFDIWRIDVDWASASSSVGRIASIPISPFDSDLCSASREACIPQPGGPALEAISDRLMHRLQLRDRGDHRTMVAAHTVDVGSGRAGIRWYELREYGGSWSLYQEGTYGPTDGQHRFMPSAAINAAGDLGIGYLISSATTYVSTAVAGQSAAASGIGALDGAELICAAGSGAQLDTARSGDYSATSVDPTTDNFWHTNEVFTTTGSFQWATFVCEFSVGSGGATNQPPTASFTFTCTELDCSFDGTGSTDGDGSIQGYQWSFGDGATATGATASHAYAAAGSYVVTLTVTDDDGAADSDSKTVTVTAGTANQPPTASFSYACTDLSCGFTDLSSDSDGTIAAWSWGFGDGATSTAQHPSHAYAAAGSYSVTLTVTDDDGATGSSSQTVSVTAPSSDITLTASGYKIRGRRYVDLSWEGASSEYVDVFRNGTKIVTTTNDGAYNDSLGTVSGTFTYQVCEAGTSTCSNTATVVF